ncbi:MAG: hypothetical protein EA426_06830 [Spirochaetaceae bacterium]|nr:MAG: hypothetical protein EA426_06830 [Spirochaetaceae bacterium]
MKITALSIASFAGLTKLEIEFGPGVTLVTGPNEAGKSTMFHAIDHILFTPARLGKRDFERTMKRFMPLSGGDTIGATLTIEHNGTHTLSREWGATPSERLCLSAGGTVTEPDEINRVIAEMLPAGPGTVRSLLLAFQSGLANAVEALDGDSATRADLSDTVRKAVLETGGVSIDRFLAEIDAMYDSAFSHWDTDRSLPERDRSGRERGIDNPWPSKVGSILAAYYQLAGTRRKHELATALELRLDARAEKITASRTEAARLDEYISENAAAVRDAHRRGELEARLTAVESTAEIAGNAMRRLPVLRDRNTTARDALAELSEAFIELDDEKSRAIAREATLQARQRAESLRAIVAQRDAAAHDLAALPLVRKDDVLRLDSARDALTRLESQLSTGSFRVTVAATQNSTVRVSRDFDPPNDCVIAADAPYRIPAGGRVVVEHAPVTVTVEPTGIDFETIEKQHDEAHRRLAQMLEALGGSREAALTRYEQYRAAQRRVEELDGKIVTELGEDTINDVLEAVTDDETETTRPIVEIVEQHSRVGAERAAAQRTVQETAREIESIERTSGDEDAIISRLAEATNEKNKLESEIAALRPIPTEHADAQGFIDAYENARTRLATTRETVRDLEKDIADAERELGSIVGDGSVEELTDALTEAGGRFEHEKSFGENVRAVHEVAHRTATALDADTFSGYDALLARYIKAMTAGAYDGIPRRGVVPEAVSGPVLSTPVGLLSTGMRDVLGLALRMTAAEVLFGESRGFLVLDDPFVDLDPSRKRAAVDVVSEFATRHQVVIFTCHPDLAPLFPNARAISVGRPE